MYFLVLLGGWVNAKGVAKYSDVGDLGGRLKGYVRHFERQFQVDGDVARNRSKDRRIGE